MRKLIVVEMIVVILLLGLLAILEKMPTVSQAAPTVKQEAVYEVVSSDILSDKSGVITVTEITNKNNGRHYLVVSGGKGSAGNPAVSVTEIRP